MAVFYFISQKLKVSLTIYFKSFCIIKKVYDNIVEINKLGQASYLHHINDAKYKLLIRDNYRNINVQLTIKQNRYIHIVYIYTKWKNHSPSPPIVIRRCLNSAPQEKNSEWRNYYRDKCNTFLMITPDTHFLMPGIWPRPLHRYNYYACAIVTYKQYLSFNS